MLSRRMRTTHRQALLRRRVAFHTLSHEHEPDEYFVDPAAARHDEMVAMLPALPPRRQARYRDQLELWRVAPSGSVLVGV